MKNVTAWLLSLGCLFAAPLTAQAQPTVDGQTTDGDYVQLGTSPPEPGGSFTGGVVGLGAHAGPDSLYVAIEAKVSNDTGDETADLVVFINSNNVDGVDSGSFLPPGNRCCSPFIHVDSMQMDMETDFGVRVTGDAENAWTYVSFADYAGYVAGDSTDDGEVKDVGDTTLKSLDGTSKTGDAPGRYAYDDTSNVNAVDGTGLEFSIPHESLGTSEEDEFQFFVVYGLAEDTLSATLIPDDGEKTLYSPSEDWTSVSGMQSTGAQVLPVELASFDARLDGDDAVLNWNTASETNNAGFAVDHASGAGDFEQVGWVDGLGTTSERQSYQFVVEGLSAGRHRFRLRQEDLDGSTNLSEVVRVKVRPEGPISIEKIAPNPVRESAMLRFVLREKGPVAVSLYDVLGRRVRTLYEGRASEGRVQRVRLNASSLPSGVYLLRVRSENGSRTQRVTVAK